MANLQVQILRRCLVRAADRSRKPCVMSLVNLDLMHSTNPSYFCFVYRKGNLIDVVATVKLTLSFLLDHFFHLAGRLTTNVVTGRPEVTCNNEGAEIVEARVNVPLASLDFHDVSKSFDVIVQPIGVGHVLSAQVVAFECGGFVLVFSSYHLLMDALGFNLFVSLFAKMAREGKFSVEPIHDRSILSRLSLPANPEFSLDHLYTTREPEIKMEKNNILVSRVYYVKAEQIERVRDFACGDGERRVTRLQAFLAHVWRVLASVKGDPQATCRVGLSVDGRRRMGEYNSKVLSNYSGNFVSFAFAEAKVSNLLNTSSSELVSKLTSTLETTNKNHFMELIHHNKDNIFLKVASGFGTPTVVVSSFPTHSKSATDFGFGPAAYDMLYIPNKDGLGWGFMSVIPAAMEDGSWIVYTSIWPKVLAELEVDPDLTFRPVHASHFGFDVPKNHLSRI